MRLETDKRPDPNARTRLCILIEYVDITESLAINSAQRLLEHFKLIPQGVARNLAIPAGIAFETSFSRHIEYNRSRVEGKPTCNPDELTSVFAPQVSCIGDGQPAERQTLLDDEVHHLKRLL